jgi:hypothetical protein
MGTQQKPINILVDSLNEQSFFTHYPVFLEAIL